MSQKLVKVIIPVYKEYFGELEEKSFLQCCKVLKDYEIVIVHPEGLNHSYLTNKFETISAKSFPKKYFQSIDGYNELLLSPLFYESFLDSEYILIYQLDAFVFKDDLVKWCEKGYDYIGAPWLATPEDTLFLKYYHKMVRKLSKKKQERHQIFYKSGNGGFSLRKVASHFVIAKKYQQFISDFLKEEKKKIYAIEDVFWSLKAPEFERNFKIPDYKEAIYFALDRKPNIGMKLTNNELPFGCHGINKPKVIDFWKPIIDKY
ncbi:DUF5672 family protein [Flavobacterium sp. KACC 22761]|uniref:DUF5672 family protein n=1 Tax=Flavobacterium sp. KACC 22761 TaxID=3092665 RepID=UPI002A7534E3|nr:DUF5672 family protein [Flavobacterium sp. KACC 22761]WPO77437.1 DUF5672 family protein [Flavobacterium sp. KACC 22761]